MNSRLDTLQAAILLPKLAILDEEIAARQEVAGRYDTAIRELGLAIPKIAQHTLNAWAQYTVRVPNRSAVQAASQECGIPTAVYYPLPLNRQPAVADDAVRLPHGDKASDEVLSLPMHPYLSAEEQERVAVALTEAVAPRAR